MKRGFLLLLLFAAGCRRAPETAGTQEPRALSPDQVIAQFTMDNFSQSARAWTLKAPRAYVYESEDRIEVEMPRIQFYDRDKPGAVMDAGRARFHSDRRDIRAWEGVVIVSTNGARLESPFMDYRAKEDLVVSSAPVTVTRAGSVLRGVGWQAKPDLSRLVVRNQTLEYVERRK